MSIISNIAFLAFIITFLQGIPRYHFTYKSNISVREDSHVWLFVKYFIFIIVITNFALISTIGVHEFGHVAVSRYFECESRSIIYEEGVYPYSEILCDDGTDKLIITLAGPIIPLLIAFILFFIGGELTRSISFLVGGFNFIASFRDLQDIGVSTNLAFGVSLIGMIFIIIGITLLARSRMREHLQQHPI